MKQIDLISEVSKRYGLPEKEAERLLKTIGYAVRFVVGGGSNLYVDGVVGIQMHPEEVKYHRKKIGRNNRTIERILAKKQKGNIFACKIVSKYGKDKKFKHRSAKQH